jgi:hypothetical protein
VKRLGQIDADLARCLGLSLGATLDLSSVEPHLPQVRLHDPVLSKHANERAFIIALAGKVEQDR